MTARYVAYVTSITNPFTPSDPLYQVALPHGTITATIDVGANPQDIAITPDGKHAYVCNNGNPSQSVSVVDLAAFAVTATIPIGMLTGAAPRSVAVTPDGGTAYVCAGEIVPIDVATNTAGTPITYTTGGIRNPFDIAITPDGTKAYVTNAADNPDGTSSIIVIDVATNTVIDHINVEYAFAPTDPAGIAITPNGATAYTCDSNTATLTPIDVATNTAGSPIAVGVGTFPLHIAITPDGKHAYVADQSASKVYPVTLATATVGVGIAIPAGVEDIAITPDGATAYVTSDGAYITPIDLATNTAGAPIGGFTIAGGTWGIAIGQTRYTPPTRQYPRDDNLALGAVRQRGGSTSQQNSIRQGWRGTYS